MKYTCCDTQHDHCHCGGDKGHNILPGCPGYKEEMVKLNLRLPGELHERLTVEAKFAVRSLNSEIIWRLRQAISGVHQ